MSQVFYPQSSCRKEFEQAGGGMSKLGINSRIEIVRYALLHDWLQDT